MGKKHKQPSEIQVDVNQRKFVWYYVGDSAVLRTYYVSVEEIEGHLLYWIESGYNPEDHSPEPLTREKLDELEMVADHTRRAA